MTALDKEPNTTIAKLHINHDTHGRADFREYVDERIKRVNALPSGYTLLRGTGAWLPDVDGLDDEIEPKSVLELWVDSEKELDAVRHLKSALERRFNQHCVCLEVTTAYYEH